MLDPFCDRRLLCARTRACLTFRRPFYSRRNMYVSLSRANHRHIFVSDYAHMSKGATFLLCSSCGVALWKKRHCPCQNVQYCDAVCQKRAWKSHKYDCTKRGKDTAVKILMKKLCKEIVDYIDDEFLG